MSISNFCAFRQPAPADRRDAGRHGHSAHFPQCRTDGRIRCWPRPACLCCITPIEIDGESYWDGGYVANPPLTPLVMESDASNVLIIQLTPTRSQTVPRSAAGDRAPHRPDQFQLDAGPRNRGDPPAGAALRGGRPLRQMGEAAARPHRRRKRGRAFGRSQSGQSRMVLRLVLARRRTRRRQMHWIFRPDLGQLKRCLLRLSLLGAPSHDRSAFRHLARKSAQSLGQWRRRPRPARSRAGRRRKSRRSARLATFRSITPTCRRRACPPPWRRWGRRSGRRMV